MEEISLEELKSQVSDHQEEEDVGQRVQLIVFKLGSEEYALPIDQIKEVVMTPPIAKVPHTPDYIKGVANIRGNIIAILDLEEKFGLNRSKDGEHNGNHYTLVVESEQYKIGVLVREVPNTLTTGSKKIDKSSNIVQFSSLNENCIQGIVKEEQRMIIMIDLLKLMEAGDFNTLINAVKE